jgi:hypothetical protein
MSAPSLAPYIAKRPWLMKMFVPLAKWYCNAAGYRKLGLRCGTLYWLRIHLWIPREMIGEMTEVLGP